MTPLLTVKDIAVRTRTSESYWRKALARRALPIVRLGRGIRVRAADLEHYLNEQHRGTRREEAGR